MIDGLLGRKLGMIQIFDSDGRMRGVTVIETGPCLITQLRTKETDGYTAVQLGFGAAKRSTKPMRGHLKNLGDLRYLREFNVDDPANHKVGDRLGAELFQKGDHVDVTGVSKGRGFAGVVKRYHFAGGPKTHGQSDRHRAGGSIGSGNTPGRVFRGQRMPGHMGAEQVTVRNLEVLESDPARGFILVAGSAPGARNGLLKIRYTPQTLIEASNRKIEAPEPEAEEVEETVTAAPEDSIEEVDETTSDAAPAAEEASPDAEKAEAESDAEKAADDEKPDSNDAPADENEKSS